MEPTFGYVFPAIRGIQARRAYYVSMCPLRLINRIFSFDDEDLRPEMRAQRTLNRARVPELSRYITGNPNNYVFSAITASIDADVKFEPLAKTGEGRSVGTLHVPMDARFIINDGQHRRAAIKDALEEDPELGDESIAVVFFLDVGLKRSQQMFADLNRHAVRPSMSLGVLFDHRDEKAQLTRQVVLGSNFFRDIIELERSSLSKGSRKLITLSALYSATSMLLQDLELEGPEEAITLSREYWETVAKHIPEWKMVQAGEMAARGVREDFIHSHGLVVKALGRVGNTLLREKRNAWKRPLSKLKTIDWSRSNSETWEGRAMAGGQVKMSSNNIILTANIIKKHLGLELGPDELRVEEAHTGRSNARKATSR